MKQLLKLQVKVFVLAAILLLSIASTLSAQKIAIIDAGSSGSRLYVYEINKDKNINVLYPSPTDPTEEANSKGRALSSVANHADSVKAYLITMTSKYKKVNMKETIPLYVLATAGMRLVPEDRANSMYYMMKSQANKLNGYTLEKAMTISGRYEGFYAWIAANYKNGKLGFSTSTTEKPLTYTGTPFGILEIGGASMQIAFAVNQPCEGSISRKGFDNIYSKSYLGAGVDQVYKTNKDRDIIKSNFNVVLDDVSHLYGSDLKFYGLGKPIKIVIEGAQKKGVAVKNYASTLTNNDSQNKYHPWMNARYIAYVVDFLKLGNRLILTNNESDWTEGAALDIIVNGKKDPEEYNYKTNN